MFEEYGKRDLAIIVALLLIAGALTAWGTVYLVNTYVIGKSDDPISKAGGLNPDQRSIQQKK